MRPVSRRQLGLNSYDLVSYPGQPQGSAHCRNLEAIEKEHESGRVKRCPFDEVAESFAVAIRGVLERFCPDALLVS